MAEIDWSKGKITSPNATDEYVNWDAGTITPPLKPVGAIRKLGDLATGFGVGAIGATKAIADAAGAGNKVSGFLDSASKDLSGLLSPQAVADQQEQASIQQAAAGKGPYEEFKAGVKAFGVAPVQTTVGGVGPMVPILGAAALGGLPGAATAGAAIGAGTAKGAIYDDIKARGIKEGLSTADAESAATRAQEYGGKNTDQIALGAGLGVLDSATGASGIAGSMVRKAMGKPVSALAARTSERGILGRAGMGMLEEMPVEFAQGAQERVAANLAAQRDGYQANTWDNAVSGGTLEALASAGPGAGFGVMHGKAPSAGSAPADPVVAPPAAPAAGPAGHPPQLGFNPLAGAPQTFPDGSSALGSEAVNAPAPAAPSPDADPQRAKRLASVGVADPAPNSPLTNAAIAAVDSGAHDAVIGAQRGAATPEIQASPTQESQAGDPAFQSGQGRPQAPPVSVGQSPAQYPIQNVDAPQVSPENLNQISQPSSSPVENPIVAAPAPTPQERITALRAELDAGTDAKGAPLNDFTRGMRTAQIRSLITQLPKAEIEAARAKYDPAPTASGAITQAAPAFQVGGVDEAVKAGLGAVTVSRGGKPVPFKDFSLLVHEDGTAEASVERASNSQGGVKGSGFGAYVALGNELAARGVKLVSGDRQHGPGKDLWARLTQAGYAQRQASGRGSEFVAKAAPNQATQQPQANSLESGGIKTSQTAPQGATSEPQANQAQPQQTQQAARAAEVAGTPGKVTPAAPAPRPATWRTFKPQAMAVARTMEIDTKGMNLEAIIQAVDQRDEDNTKWAGQNRIGKGGQPINEGGNPASTPAAPDAPANQDAPPPEYASFEAKTALLQTSADLVAPDGRLNEQGNKLARTPWESLTAQDRATVQKLSRDRRASSDAYNDKVRAEERAIVRRQMQAEDVIRQANGKPFKGESAARAKLSEFDLSDTHKIAPTVGGFVLRQMPLAEQAEARRKAEGRESYTEAQNAVLAEMGIDNTSEDGEISATDAQWMEIERRTNARLRGNSDTLTTPTAQDIIDQQARAEAAAKAEKAQQRAADELARRERERKDIAKASEAAADTFELGGNAEQNLSGQTSLLDEPATPAPNTEAAPATPAPITPKSPNNEAARAAYYTPGHVILSHTGTGHDEVLSYAPQTAEKSWSVKVQPVKRINDKWEKVGRAVTHRYPPNYRNMAVGNVRYFDGEMQAPAIPTTKARTVSDSEIELIKSNVGDLPAKDITRLETQYGAAMGSDTFTEKLRADVVSYVNKGMKSLSLAIAKIIKAVSEGVLAMGLVFNPAAFNSNQFEINLPRTVQTWSTAQVQSTKITTAQIPDAAKAKMSPLAQQVYESMAPSAMQVGKSFIVADKSMGMIHIFNADGSVMAQDAALYGKDKGDAITGKSSLVGGAKITPAGKFTLKATRDAEYAGGVRLDLRETRDGGTIIAVHAAWLGDAKENRAARLTSPNPSDNRVSYGCINTTHATFLEKVLPNIDTFDGGLIFVLPEAGGDVAAMFPAQPITTSETTTTITEGMTRGPSAAPDDIKGNSSFMRERDRATVQQGKKDKPKPDESVNDLVQATVDAIRAGWTNAPDVIVVADMSDPRIPSKAKDSDARQRSLGAGKIEGFFYQGKVYLVSSALKTPQDATRVLYHEALGHLGFRGAFGDSLNTILNQIATMRNAEVTAKAKAYKLDMSDPAQRLQAAEEVLAEMAQSRPELGFVKRAISAIRNWLRANVPGFKSLALTDTDIAQAYLIPARGWVERGRAAGAGGSAAFSRGATDQTDAPAFKKWFGDSRIVDDNEKPLVVYHGTNANIKEFGGQEWAGWFSKETRLADEYIRPARDLDSVGPSIIPAYLSIENPLWISVDMNDPVDAIKPLLQQLGMDDDLSNDYGRGSMVYRVVTSEKFSKSVKGLGYDGIIVNEGGVETYAAARSAQIKSTIGNNGDFDPANPDIRFSRSPAAANTAWATPEKSEWFDDLTYKLQDKQIDTKRVIEAIRTASGALADERNVYLQESLYHGRAAARSEDFVNKELGPLVNAMRMRGLDIAMLDEYLHARHAEEANALVSDRNPDIQDGGSGMTTADARAYLAGLDAGQRAKLEAVAAKVDAILAGTRQLYADYSLESQKTIDGWGDMFSHYVPLMREDDGGGTGIGQGFSIKGRETRSRTGSTRKVVDILANIAMQRERAIVRGEKNRVATALVGLAEANPNKEFWHTGPPPKEKAYDAKTNSVVERADPMYKSRENVLMAKIKKADGTVIEKAVVFNEDNERAMRMSAALKNLDAAHLEGLLGAAGMVTRYFAKVNTQLNPIFGVVNLVRDVQSAILNLTSTALKGKGAQVASHVFSALAGVYQDARAARNGQTPNSTWAALNEEFRQEGGQTGFRDAFTDSNDRANAIRRELNPDAWMDSLLGKIFTAGGALKVPLAIAQKRATGLFGWLSDYNLAMENAVRLSAYKVAREQGMSKQQAASLAKELTVNFNRKGQIGSQAGALYAFFNASMQGTARLGETLFSMEPGKPKTLRLSATGRNIVLGGVTLGVMHALLLSAAGFDDEEPPDFVRERSLIIPTGWLAGPDKGYITIPMPLGLHILPNMGRIPTEFALNGFKNPEKKTARLFGIITDAFNPVGGGASLLQTLAPTPIDPLAALAENKDWTGKNIAKTSRNPATPGHLLTKDTASHPAKLLAEAINVMSGGTEYVAGILSPTPDQIDYLWSQATGGVGREVSKAQQSVSTVFSGEDLPINKIPLAGRFYGNADTPSAQSNKFYIAIDRLNRHEEQIKGLRKDGRGAEVAAYLAENPDARLFMAANAAERQVQNLRNQKRELLKKDAPAERVKLIEGQIASRMTAFNDLVQRTAR